MKKMTFNEYQEKAWDTAIYPDKGENIIYPTLGLCGESGEFAEKIKKIIREDGGKISRQKWSELIKEASDCLWYIAAICSELKIAMEEVAELNLKKLSSRKERGVLHGSGDER